MSEITNFRCQDCGHTAPESEFPEAMGLLRGRLQVGDIFTDRECPECGALAYPADRVAVARQEAGAGEALYVVTEDDFADRGIDTSEWDSATRDRIRKGLANSIDPTLGDLIASAVAFATS